MKRLLAALILLASTFASAQEASIPSPIARASVAKYRIDVLHTQRSPQYAQIQVVRQDASNNDIDSFEVLIGTQRLTGCPFTPTSTLTIAGLMTAMANPAPNETGVDTRRMNFRVLTYLSTTTGCIQGVTLVP